MNAYGEMITRQNRPGRTLNGDSPELERPRSVRRRKTQQIHARNADYQDEWNKTCTQNMHERRSICDCGEKFQCGSMGVSKRNDDFINVPER